MKSPHTGGATEAASSRGPEGVVLVDPPGPRRVVIWQVLGLSVPVAGDSTWMRLDPRLRSRCYARIIVMTIKVKQLSDDSYTALATIPEWRGGGSWSTSRPMDGKSLVEELMRRGWHVQDVVDAMIEADPTWLEKHKKQA